jgi:hypothetical protein
MLAAGESGSYHYIEYKISILGKKIYCKDASGSNIEFQLNDFMWFKVVFEPTANCLYKCLDAKLTSVGDSQLDVLESHLTTLSIICRSDKNIYAPFTSFIQSSGFGKTKLCLELLKKHPGVYLVFRQVTDTGIPYMTPYMKEFTNFITNAPKDELPMDLYLLSVECAIDYSPGRFIIALFTLIKAYHALLANTINNLQNERLQPLEIIAEAIKRLGVNYTLEPNVNSLYNLDVNFNAYQALTFSALISGITLECNAINATIRSSSVSPFPFLLLLDEADVFNKSNLKGKILGINIVRRGLHLLDSNTSLLALAIGTNSDALEFAPAVNDDSLRIVTKNILLPPFILSGNWDILSDSLEFNLLEMGKEELLNPAFFKVLVTMGRAMWSSCRIVDVISVAKRKLKNGDSNCIGALIAPLLVRANIDVNVNHVLARNLIKSYMIIVSYVSTDAKNLKIGYSSEPVLAFAARNLLSVKEEREKSFRALKTMLEEKAIDKGRIVEVVFEHLALFAIDDAEMCPLQPDLASENESSQALPKTAAECVRIDGINKILSKKLCILNEDDDQKSAEVSNLFPDYRIVTLKKYFTKLLKDEWFETQVKPVLHESVLNGLLNVSHFVQLENLLEDDFKELYDKKIISKLLKKVIDRSNLKCGIIRTFGVVMPPGYPGIDFIIPFLIDDPDNKFRRPLYSFIAFQSKTSKTTTTDCAYKMAANLHLVNCPHSDHKTPDDCAKSNCIAGFTQEEIDEICAHQVVVLLTAKNDETNFERRAKITVALKDYKINGPSKSNEDKDRILSKKLEIKNNCQSRYGDYLSQVQNEDSNIPITAISYPAFSKAAGHERPDFILTKVVNSQLNIQQMVWDSSEKDIVTMEEQDSKKPPVFLNTRGPRTLTCIDIHDIWAFDHLLSKNTIAVILEMISMTNSNFHSVEPIHLPIVQNSMINGKFSPYHALNTQLNLIRGLKISVDPASNNKASEEFKNKWTSAIEACAKGPVQSKLDPPSLPDDYHKAFKKVKQENYLEYNSTLAHWGGLTQKSGQVEGPIGYPILMDILNKYSRDGIKNWRRGRVMRDSTLTDLVKGSALNRSNKRGAAMVEEEDEEDEEEEEEDDDDEEEEGEFSGITFGELSQSLDEASREQL